MRSTSTGRMGGPLRRALGLAALLLCVWYFVLPTSLGGFNTMTIVSGPSMEPRFHTGDLVIARPADAYDVGDVVTYRIPDPLYSRHRVVHRIVLRSPDGRYLTRGDNQDHDDPWAVPHDNIAGRQVVVVPRGGYVLGYMHNPICLAAVFALLVTYMFWPTREGEAADDVENQSGAGSGVTDTTPTATAAGAAPVELPFSPLAGESGARFESDIERFIEEWSLMYATAPPVSR